MLTVRESDSESITSSVNCICIFLVETSTVVRKEVKLGCEKAFSVGEGWGKPSAVPPC